MNLEAICDGLQANLETVTSTPPLTAYPYLPDDFAAPAAVVSVVNVDYHKTFGDAPDLEVSVIVLVARTDVGSAQTLLRGFMEDQGATSIRQAIESDCTLGGAASDLVVRSGKRGPAIQVGDSAAVYLTAEFDVFVMA